MRTVAGVLGAAGLLAAAVGGCSFNFSAGSTPTVSAADLQNDIKDRLTKAGESPQSVTCKDDLVGVVDKTTRCEVVLSETNAFEPIVKVTKVEGATVNYEMTPALSQQQLEKAVGVLVEGNSDQKVESVTCGGGLEGKVGNTADCTVVGGGESMDTVVNVTKVTGLMMNFEVKRA
jgi:hypothetical protein